jgi:hypothetical protein
MKIYKLFLLNLSIILLGSCARESGMRVTTNTFANKEVIPQGFKKQTSFSISTKQKGDPLFTREVAQKIATILRNKGFTIKTTSDVEYNLNFSFAMSKSTHVRDVPVYIPDYGHWHYHHYHHGYGFSIAYIPKEFTLFHKILLLEVYKNSGSRAERIVPVWQGTAHVYEEDSDLRDAIDYLLVTVFKYFGRNTKRYIKSKMEDDNEEVRKLRQEYFQPIGYIEKK